METSATKQQPLAGGSIATAEAYLRLELQRRRERLDSALRSPVADASLSTLLTQVDEALNRLEAGTYGLCESCHEPIEADRLLANPVEQFCLDHLPADERRALEGDLRLAASIQRGLLPPRDFSSAGWDVHYHYAPAGLVSGDYCDLLETPAGLLFLLGDVSGKGVAASMLMSHLHATFRSLVDASGQYATLVAGRAARDGQVEFISAGHLPLLHLSGSGAIQRDSTGLPLGMFRDARFPVHRFAFEPGDTLLLFTDGLTEATNDSGAEYGLEPVRQLAARHTTASPEKLINECLTELRSFSNGAKQRDDLALLALRRTN